MNIESWLIFFSIAFIATITPGPAILLVSTHSIIYGLKRALATILGNISGLFVMSVLSIIGLSTMLLYSNTIFIAVKFAGGAYLIYLGVKLWRFGFSGKINKNSKPTERDKIPSVTSLYVQGLFVALSNPKAIAFTTALFPQFIEPSLPLAPQFSVLVATFMFLSFSCLLAYGFTAVNLSNKETVTKVSGFCSKAFGSAFIASGLILANASQK